MSAAEEATSDAYLRLHFAACPGFFIRCCNIIRAMMTHRGLDVDTGGAAAFKSALYQGSFGDLNLYVTALKNGVLG